MPTIDGIDYESTFGGVIFSASQAQSGEFPTDFAEETIVGGAVSGTSYTYRDWYANPPDTLDLPILLPDRATLDALAALRAYPVDTGGVPYELHTAQFDWAATMDKLTWSGAYLDTPVQAKATFTKIADLSLTAPTGPTSVTASFVFGTDGLDAEFDANGASSSDGQIDVVNWEFGDSGIATQTGPWETGGSNIPTQLHTYAAPGEYVVNCSVERNGVTSDDFSVLVTVT
jgi:hypothetical protein